MVIANVSFLALACCGRRFHHRTAGINQEGGKVMFIVLQALSVMFLLMLTVESRVNIHRVMNKYLRKFEGRNNLGRGRAELGGGGDILVPWRSTPYTRQTCGELNTMPRVKRMFSRTGE